jgi:hypothetical protein
MDVSNMANSHGIFCTTWKLTKCFCGYNGYDTV